MGMVIRWSFQWISDEFFKDLETKTRGLDLNNDVEVAYDGHDDDGDGDAGVLANDYESQFKKTR